jgi:hypothetical protein
MNQAMEMLHAKATALYEQIAGESKIGLQIDPLDNIPCDVKVHYGVRCGEETLAPGYHAQPTAFIMERTDKTERMENGLMSCNAYGVDPCIAHLNWLFEQNRKVKVWIYNISQEEHTLGNGVIKSLKVPACKDNELYSVVTSLPAVFITSKPNVDSGEIDYVVSDGRRIAMDLINPSNLGIDQNANCDSLRWGSAIGNDFSKKGVFFSTHNPPLKKELREAHKRLKSYYIDLMERANIVRLTSAASTLGVKTSEISAAQQYVEDLSGNR